MEDGSIFENSKYYLLNYDFDRSLVEKIGFKDLRVSLQANNIATFTKYSGQDPSIGGADTSFGIDVGNYPVTPKLHVIDENIKKVINKKLI